MALALHECHVATAAALVCRRRTGCVTDYTSDQTYRTGRVSKELQRSSDMIERSITY